MSNVKDYIVTSVGISKKTGKPYCFAKEIITLEDSHFIADKGIPLNEQRPVGSIIQIQSSIVDTK